MVSLRMNFGGGIGRVFGIYRLTEEVILLYALLLVYKMVSNARHIRVKSLLQVVEYRFGLLCWVRSVTRMILVIDKLPFFFEFISFRPSLTFIVGIFAKKRALLRIKVTLVINFLFVF